MEEKNKKTAAEAEATVDMPEQEQQEEAQTENQVVEVSAADLEKMLASVGQLAKDKEDAEQKLLRLQADFDNFRRRSRQEKEDTVKTANRALLLDLLLVVDNFERALENSDGSPFAQGVDMIYRQMMQVLESNGLEKLNTNAVPFDPAFHEAVLQEVVPEEQKGQILQTFKTGYLLHGKLLRAAAVKVGV